MEEGQAHGGNTAMSHTTIGKVSNRQIRQAVNKQADAIAGTIAPTLRSLVNDELKTRSRVDALEQWRDASLRERVLWLLRGYR